ncbi:MAG: aminoacyl-tRNA hydrolase [Olegusella sp.]|nr:aminoacyl-tRNA hydrolase [Olegusella sp.]
MPQGPKDIRIVCGLGNPGKEYELTRHSIGFAVVDRLAADHGVRYWKSEAGCQVASIEVKKNGEAREVLLAKPQDYMNTSGGPLSKLARAHHVKPAEILVVHDEVDLPAGSVAAKWGGGLNAHNGLRSVADKLGTRDFARVRCGIGRPPGKMDVATYVLRQLKGGYVEEFELLAADGAACVEACLAGTATWR